MANFSTFFEFVLTGVAAGSVAIVWLFFRGRQRRQGFYLLAEFFISHVAVSCDHASALSQIGTA